MRKYYFSFTLSGLLLLLISSTGCMTPRKDFAHTRLPAAPNYANEKNWSALPSRKDSADAVPLKSALRDDQQNAKADVFFVHPTMYFGNQYWNGSIENQSVNKNVDRFPVRMQASVFNGSCKVYAPRYRQATLGAFIDKSPSGRIALDTAYNDVKRAFRYYLDHYNNGRPIIIAGHSQGTHHAVKLLEDFFDQDTVLRKQLVAAYLVGGAAGENMYTTILPCDSATQTGCYVAWHTLKHGKHFPPPNKRTKNELIYDNSSPHTCTNPVSWKRTNEKVPASKHIGAAGRGFRRLHRSFIETQISPDHELWVRFKGQHSFPRKWNYHVYDYSLFYLDIRKNVADRLNSYFQKTKK